jgi:dTDP-4-dehydrorhamnose reductase
MKLSIGLLGYKGFIGSEISQLLESDRSCIVRKIDRELFADKEIRNFNFDLLIHAANPARRFFANSNPEIDFKDTVEKITEIINCFKYKRLLLISSLSCRTQPDSIYGKHRLICEELAHQNNGAVVRLGPLFGGYRKNDTLHDILNNETVYYADDTKYCYANIDWVANFIVNNLFLLYDSKISEVGARDWITLGEISKFVNSRSVFIGQNDDQVISSFELGPSAKEVFEFVRMENAHRL